MKTIFAAILLSSLAMCGCAAKRVSPAVWGGGPGGNDNDSDTVMIGTEFDIGSWPPPQASVQGLDVFPQSTHTVTLTWNAPNVSPDYTFRAYRVYRRPSTQTFWTQYATGVKAITYTDQNVTNGVTYYYEVKAVWVDSTGKVVLSAPTNRVQAIIPAN